MQESGEGAGTSAHIHSVTTQHHHEHTHISARRHSSSHAAEYTDAVRARDNMDRNMHDWENVSSQCHTAEYPNRSHLGTKHSCSTWPGWHALRDLHFVGYALFWTLRLRMMLCVSIGIRYFCFAPIPALTSPCTACSDCDLTLHYPDRAAKLPCTAQSAALKSGGSARSLLYSATTMRMALIAIILMEAPQWRMACPRHPRCCLISLTATLHI